MIVELENTGKRLVYQKTDKYINYNNVMLGMHEKLV